MPPLSYPQNLLGYLAISAAAVVSIPPPAFAEQPVASFNAPGERSSIAIQPSASDAPTDDVVPPMPRDVHREPGPQSDVPPAAVKNASPPNINSLWADVPPLQPLPRIGWFSIAPTGPGYYSARDFLADRYRQSPPRVPYPPVSSDPISFFDADYRYLDDPAYTDRDLFDRIKRQHPNKNWMWSLGGEERVRSMNEVNSRLTIVHNEYVLTRSRVYADCWYGDQLRFYAEMQDSQTTPQALPPLRSDVDQTDLLNLFTDIKLGEFNERPAYVRAGRQELYFGSQRLISPSDFPNVRRTFTGVKGFWRGKNWDLDVFWVEPVPALANQFDRPDPRQQLVGVWNNYRPRKGQQIDVYYLMYDNANRTAVGSGGVLGGYTVNTIGSRYAGDWHQVLWDFEGMYQFGGYVNQQISAAATVSGLGYRFAQLPGTPHFWTYYEWATGQLQPDGSQHRTFNQLFPWGHAYFGYLDLVGRQNIRDLNMQLNLFPAKWITPALQYHVFRLDSARDALYAANGAVLRVDPTGAAGRDVGNEIDFTVNFHLARHQELFVGYSKLFAGSFIKQTGPGGSPEVTYVSYSFKW